MRGKIYKHQSRTEDGEFPHGKGREGETTGYRINRLTVTEAEGRRL